LVYYPPYHSKYNPIERCWAILETHWNGELLDSISKAVGWAGSMTWKGIKPVVHVLEKVYETGVSLTKKELKPYLSKLKRSLNLHKCDICMNSINGLNICFGFPNHSISGYPLTCTVLRKEFLAFIIMATRPQRPALQRFTCVWATDFIFLQIRHPSNCYSLLRQLDFFGHA